MKRTLTLKLYELAMRAFHHLAPIVLTNRVNTGKEDPLRFQERLGHTKALRPEGALIWFHGVSVGESLSALPIIEKIRESRPDLTILMTSGTTTSAEILMKRLPKGVIHQFAPIDTPRAVNTFLDYWKPQMAVFIESDIWPNLLFNLDQRGIKRALLSARITPKTFGGWQIFKRSVKQILSGFCLVMAQDKQSANFLVQMGVTCGKQANLKTLGAPLIDNVPHRQALEAQIGQREIILAASTHSGEENMIAEALKGLLLGELDMRPLLIIAPRHPIRANDICFDLRSLGFNVSQRSKHDPITSNTHIYIADTLGELGVFFRLSQIVIMGGSFIGGVGGHNPLEAARLGKSVIFGHDIANWRAIFEQIITHGAGFSVKDMAELSFLITQLSQNPKAIKTADLNALTLAQSEDKTLDTVCQALFPLLPNLVNHGD